jgi:hypothetical protein
MVMIFELNALSMIFWYGMQKRKVDRMFYDFMHAQMFNLINRIQLI